MILSKETPWSSVSANDEPDLENHLIYEYTKTPFIGNMENLYYELSWASVKSFQYFSIKIKNFKAVLLETRFLFLALGH
jgi:hypothetical protein